MDCGCGCVSKVSRFLSGFREHFDTDPLSLSLDLGQGPSPHFDDSSIRNTSELSTYSHLPVDLRHSLMIQACSYDGMMRLSKAAEGPYGIPGGDNCFDIMWQCEKIYDDLFQALRDQLSLINRLELQNARLHVQCLYLLYDTQSDAQLTGILRAYSTASDIITMIISDESSHDVLPYAPLRTSRMIFMAAVLILRILHSNLAAGLDYNNGRLLVNAAAFSLRQFSVVQKDKDLPVRASEMLRAFWRAAERSPNMSRQGLTLRVKSRMGASLIYDCLLRFRNNYTHISDETGAVHGQNMSPSRSEIASSSIQDDSVAGIHMSNAGTTFPDCSLFPSNQLDVSPDVDLTDMAWLEDIGYSGFADIEAW